MYTFKLQAVLDHRQFIEDGLKKELAEIRQRVDAAERHLETLTRDEREAAERLTADQTAGISSDRVVVYHDYLKGLADRIRRQKESVAGLRGQETAKQSEVLDAMKGRQMLEKLKEQGIRRYHRSLLEQETRFIDEIAVNRFARKTLDSQGDGR